MDFLYQVSSWCPDSDDDIVYLVQAPSFTEAATLVDGELGSSDMRKQCSGFSNNVIELGQSLASEAGVRVISGPYLALSAASGGFKCWSRDRLDDNWYDWSSETDDR